MARTKKLKTIRASRSRRTRARIHGSSDRPRLSVFRSNRYTYAQLINDADGKTILSVSTRGLEDKKNKKSAAAALLGEKIAIAANKVGIKKAVFDRGGYRYHGRVRAVAESARKAGLTI